MRFSDHHQTILAGGYPAIHDKLKGIIRAQDIMGKTVLDAGACTGSLAMWAMAKGARSVVINEARADYIQRAEDYNAKHSALYGYEAENVVFDNSKIDLNWHYPIRQLDTLIARRFVYLLRNKQERNHFVKEIKRHGCTTVYLQGLVRVKNHAEPLWNVELEAQAFLDFGYVISHYNGNDLIRLEIPQPNSLVGAIS